MTHLEERQIAERSNRMRKYPLALFLALVMIPAAMAQDLHKSYMMGSGSSIKIQNISGNIKITGYGGSAIAVDATVTGRDRQLITVEDLSTLDSLVLRAKYPEQSGNIEASVDFEVRVPSMISYNFDRINSVSGNIDVAGVRGNLSLNSVSGTVTASEITGAVTAKSVSGNVEVDIPRVEGSGDMQFSSISGNVIVAAPSTIGANIEMSTLSGALETSFPIQVQEKKFGPGSSARGLVGARADFNLRLSTISGKVSLTGK
jgi:DUF4097 and DUF4098 domain-containing protein YvlB